MDSARGYEVKRWLRDAGLSVAYDVTPVLPRVGLLAIGPCSKRGAVAQLGERLNGIQEVRGSIPLGSTMISRTYGVAREIASENVRIVSASNQQSASDRNLETTSIRFMVASLLGVYRSELTLSRE